MTSTKKTSVDEREWEIQERAMHAAPGHQQPDVDPALESYRRVAAALVSAPHAQPPEDFASSIARQVAQQHSGLERLLFRGLLVTLAGSAVVVTAVYGEGWRQALQLAADSAALQWPLAAAGCAALSWLLGQLLRSANLDGGAAARIGS